MCNVRVPLGRSRAVEVRQSATLARVN